MTDFSSLRKTQGGLGSIQSGFPTPMVVAGGWLGQASTDASLSASAISSGFAVGDFWARSVLLV